MGGERVKRIFFSTLLLALLTCATAQVYLGSTELEIGMQNSGQDWAPFGYVSQNIHVTDFTLGQIWLIPSTELSFGSPLTGFVQVEGIMDTSAFSISGRVRYDSSGDWRARVGMLLTLDLFGAEDDTTGE